MTHTTRIALVRVSLYSYPSEFLALAVTKEDGLFRFGWSDVDSVLTWAYLSSAFFTGNIDNTMTLGRPSQRWSVVYAVTGTINTSDERHKQQIRCISDTEKQIALELKDSIRAFKWSDSVEKKGDYARWHFGVMAQKVKSIFAKHGLDAHKYGLFCYDKWDAKEALTEDVLDSNGEPTGETKVIEKATEAGDRYGIRYDQLLAFIISAM